MENSANNSINFISSKDAKKEHLMHSASDNIKFMPYKDSNEIVDELFMSLCSKYQLNLKTSMRGNGFIFDSV